MIDTIVLSDHSTMIHSTVYSGTITDGQIEVSCFKFLVRHTSKYIKSRDTWAGGQGKTLHNTETGHHGGR